MKVYAINGSPRKSWNTAMLLENALKGAAAQGAETELIHLYDLNFKGCTSCFGCKLKGGKSYGKCAMRDDLTPVLENWPLPMPSSWVLRSTSAHLPVRCVLSWSDFSSSI